MPTKAEYDAHLEELKAETIEKLEWKIWDVVGAVRSCLDQRLWEPALILLYSNIDALAWLGCPKEQTDVTRADFIGWVSTYMLPIEGTDCTAEDLYAARCGLLHTHTADSRLNRNKRARRVYYHRTCEGRTLGVLQVRMQDTLWPVSVDVDVMVAAFQRAVVAFARDVAADPDRFTTLVTRVITSYMAEVEWHGVPGAAGVSATIIRR